MKRIVNALEVLFLIIMVLLCILVFMAGAGKVPYVFGYRILQVITDSMYPAIESQTCIMIKQVDKEDIRVGDIITFEAQDYDIKGYLNTHRVHEIIEDAESGETLYITKGDAYEEPDAFPVRFEEIAGKYVGELPFGKLVFRGIYLLTDRVNYFIVVIVPLFLCFISYVKQLLKALFSKEKDINEKGRDH